MKKSKVFEELKKQLILKRVREKWKIPFDFMYKMQFKGKGIWLTHDMVEKMKLLNQRNYYLSRIPRK